MLRFKTYDMIQEMAAVKVSNLNAEFLARAQRVTSFNLNSNDFTTIKYKAEIQHLFQVHLFKKFNLEKTIKGQPRISELNNLIRSLKKLHPREFLSLHNYNLKGIGPGETTLFFLLDDAVLGGGSSAAADIIIGGQPYEVKAGNYNAKQKAYKDFKLGGTVPLEKLVAKAFQLRDSVDPDLKMSRGGKAEKNGVNGQQIEAILKDRSLAADWNKNVEIPYGREASKYLNKNPLILMVNTTPKSQIGEIYHIGPIDPKKIKVDVVTQGTIKPKILV